MRKHVLLLTIFLVCLTAQSGCNKIYHCNGDTRMDILFKLPVSISPAKDTFHLGDTIWIENSFSDNIHDHRNNKAYEVKDFNFQTTMGITDLNSPEPAISFANPNIVTYIGKTTGSHVQSTAYQAIRLDYLYKDDSYQYKAAFIPDKPGFYLLKFFSYLDAAKVDITACKQETLYLEYLTNNAGNNNYELIKNAVDPYYSTWTLEEFNKAGGYCFYVK